MRCITMHRVPSSRQLRRVWDVRTSKVVKELAASDKVVAMELSMDDAVVTCATAKEVQFWDAKT